jgi:hypothetical protein
MGREERCTEGLGVDSRRKRKLEDMFRREDNIKMYVKV